MYIVHVQVDPSKKDLQNSVLEDFGSKSARCILVSMRKCLVFGVLDPFAKPRGILEKRAISRGFESPHFTARDGHPDQ